MFDGLLSGDTLNALRRMVPPPSISLPRILFPDRVRAHLKAAAEAQKAELEETIQKLMADGVSAAEILEKLK